MTEGIRKAGEAQNNKTSTKWGTELNRINNTDIELTPRANRLKQKLLLFSPQLSASKLLALVRPQWQLPPQHTWQWQSLCPSTQCSASYLGTSAYCWRRVSSPPTWLGHLKTAFTWLQRKHTNTSAMPRGIIAMYKPLFDFDYENNSVLKKIYISKSRSHSIFLLFFCNENLAYNNEEYLSFLIVKNITQNGNQMFIKSNPEWSPLKNNSMWPTVCRSSAASLWEINETRLQVCGFMLAVC